MAGHDRSSKELYAVHSFRDLLNNEHIFMFRFGSFADFNGGKTFWRPTLNREVQQNLELHLMQTLEHYLQYGLSYGKIVFMGKNYG